MITSDPVLVINNIPSLSLGRIHRLCNQSGGSEKLKGNVIRSSCLDIFTNPNDIRNQLRISVSIAMGKKNVIVFPTDLFLKSLERFLILCDGRRIVVIYKCE